MRRPGLMSTELRGDGRLAFCERLGRFSSKPVKGFQAYLFFFFGRRATQRDPESLLNLLLWITPCLFPDTLSKVTASLSTHPLFIR